MMKRRNFLGAGLRAFAIVTGLAGTRLAPATPDGGFTDEELHRARNFIGQYYLEHPPIVVHNSALRLQITYRAVPIVATDYLGDR